MEVWVVEEQDSDGYSAELIAICMTEDAAHRFINERQQDHEGLMKKYFPDGNPSISPFELTTYPVEVIE